MCCTICCFSGIYGLTNSNDIHKQEGLSPNFHQLDIESVDSIAKFRDYMKSTYGGIDVLVNNAAIAFKNSATEPFSEQAEVTCRVNFFATMKFCDEMLPLLKPHGRVVNVSSSAGFDCIICSTSLQFKNDSNLLCQVT